MNAGERDELLIKLQLIHMRDTGAKINGVRIESVGFGGFEYYPLPKNFDSYNLREEELADISRHVGVTKAGVFDKSDVYVNDIGISLKSFSAAPPALVNHTARPGFETACKYARVSIEDLDWFIDKYWYLRMNGDISEDIRNSDYRSPFRDSQYIMKPILDYFLFTGSGRGESAHPAEYILDYLDPCNPRTWQLLNPDNAVDFVWDRLIFSMRAKKGMPYEYDKETYAGLHADSIARWTRFHSGKYRGALHIRVHS